MILAIYIPLCILLAWYNKKLILKGKRIYHGLNGLFHLAVAGIGVYFYGWLMLPIILLTGRVIFDTSLSLFRGLPADYVPFKPKSIIDKVEKYFFGYNGWLPKIIYLVIVIVLMFLL